RAELSRPDRLASLVGRAPSLDISGLVGPIFLEVRRIAGPRGDGRGPILRLGDARAVRGEDRRVHEPGPRVVLLERLEEVDGLTPDVVGGVSVDVPESAV